MLNLISIQPAGFGLLMLDHTAPFTHSTPVFEQQVVTADGGRKRAMGTSGIPPREGPC